MEIEDYIRKVIEAIDDDPDREGLVETPARYKRFLREFFEPQEFNFTTFDAEGYDEMLIQANIPFYSMCEHHLVPFFGVSTIAYIPDKKIVGLSKLSRTLSHYSRRLQNQERITMQIADFLEKELSPKGVGVTLTARHLCMEMRGVEKVNSPTTTTALRGSFRDNHATRAEFLRFIRD